MADSVAPPACIESGGELAAYEQLIEPRPKSSELPDSLLVTIP
jgi:hypothetical protein